MNLLSFAFVDPSMLFSTMTLKYGRHFDTDNGPDRLVHPVFADCRHIVLRGPEGDDWSADGAQVDYPLLAEWPSTSGILADIGEKIAAHIGAPNLQFGRVMLRALKPGGCIGWHAEDSAYAKAHHRFCLLISPCAGGCWYSGGEMLAPGVGNLTYFNHRLLNSMINLGPVPQVTLIADVRGPTLQ